MVRPSGYFCGSICGLIRTSASGHGGFGMGTGNFCRFSYRKMKEYNMSPLPGGAAVGPEDGAEQAGFLAHREAMGTFLEHLLLIREINIAR